MGQFLGNANLLDAVSIFIYTWSFLDVVIYDQEGYVKKLLIYYKNISIIAVPILIYSLYSFASYKAAQYGYNYQRGQQ